MQHDALPSVPIGLELTPNAQPQPDRWRTMVERRSIGRTTISKSALLFFDARRGISACLVRNITNGGAGIQLRDVNALPPDFELTFDSFRTIRRCRVIWRQGDVVGVAFQN